MVYVEIAKIAIWGCLGHQNCHIKHSTLGSPRVHQRGRFFPNEHRHFSKKIVCFLKKSCNHCQYNHCATSRQNQIKKFNTKCRRQIKEWIWRVRDSRATQLQLQLHKARVCRFASSNINRKQDETQNIRVLVAISSFQVWQKLLQQDLIGKWRSGI